jgi:hypothetical protein
MSDSSDVEVFIVTTVCEEVERKRNADERLFVSGCNEGEFRRLCGDLVKKEG